MKKLLVCLMVVALAFGLVACGAQKTEEKKELSLATSADFPPYEFVDDAGQYAGIDIEVAGKIAEKLGMELKVENMEFGAVISSVSTGKCNIGMSGITVTEERKENVNFSDSYATAVQVIIVKENSPIKSVDDLYAQGAKYSIGTQLNTTGALYVSDDIEKGKMTCTIQEYKVASDAVAALTAGKIDCVIIDSEPAKNFVAANPGLNILQTEYITEEYAIALAKDDTELLEKVNQALKELKEDGTLQQIADKYIKAE